MSDYLDSLTAETAMPMDKVPILRYPYSTDSPTPAQIAELMAEMGIDPHYEAEFNVDDVSTAVASFLEYGNGLEASHIEPSTMYLPYSPAQLPDRTARIRQQHSAYAFDTVMESPLVFGGVEKKSEYEMAKYEPVVFERDGEITSTYCWLEENSTWKVDPMPENSSVESAYKIPVDAISARNVTPAGLNLTPEMQPYIHWKPAPIVNPESIQALLHSYQQQANPPYNDVVKGLGRP